MSTTAPAVSTSAAMTNEQKLAELRTRRALLAQSTESLVVKEASALKSLSAKIQRADESYQVAIAASDKVLAVIDRPAAAQRLAEAAERQAGRVASKATTGTTMPAAKAA